MTDHIDFEETTKEHFIRLYQGGLAELNESIHETQPMLGGTSDEAFQEAIIGFLDMFDAKGDEE
jgi:hypothetical protein